MTRHHRSGLLLLGGGVIVVVAVASAIRVAIERQFRLGESMTLVDGVLWIRRGENSGVAFGLLRDSPIVPIVTTLGVIGIAIIAARSQSRGLSLSWGLIVGGGLANVIDRIDDGRVTDYIDVVLAGWHYPTFNAPDIAVSTGMVLLLWTMIFNDPARSRPTEHDVMMDAGRTQVRASCRPYGQPSSNAATDGSRSRED